MFSVKRRLTLFVTTLVTLGFNESAPPSIAGGSVPPGPFLVRADNEPQETGGRIKGLAEKLTNANTEEDRQGLLAAEKELVTAELVKELIDSAERLRLKGEYDHAQNLNRLAQAIAERIGDQTGVARVMLTMGNVHQGQGDYELAMDYFRRSLPLLEAAKYQRGITALFVNMGLNYRLQGDFDKALEYYQQGLKRVEAVGGKADIANILNLIGVVYRLQGNGRLALEYFQKALPLFEETGSQPGVTGTLNNIGNIYLQQGQIELAEESYRKSLALAEKQKNRPQIGQSLNNLGRARRQLGDYAKALEFYRQSLSVREEAGDKVGIPRTLQNIAETYSAMRDYERALEYFDKSLVLHESMGSKSDIALTSVSVGKLHLSRGNFKSSLEWSERAAHTARELNRLEVLWQALTTAGEAQRALKQYPKARLSFAEAIAVVEELRGQVAGGEQEQQRFFEGRVSPYHAMAELLVENNEWAEAFAHAERAKARVLLDVLQSGRAGLATAMTISERDQEQKLRSSLVTLNNQVTRESQSAKPDPTRIADSKARLQKARLAYEGFQTNLYTAHPELRIQRGDMRPLSLDEAGALLPDAHTALLEYVVAVDKTYLFALTKSSPDRTQPELKVYTLDVKQNDLAAESEQFRRQLAQRDQTYGDASRRLYDLLLKPAEGQLRGKNTLVIVPDAKLWDLPFQALQDARNRHLIESHAISYAPSLTVLREMVKARAKNRGASSPTLLAVGNPTLGKETIQRAKSVLLDETLEQLPEAERQVKALGELYGPARSRVYVGPDAREERFKKEAGNYRILQLATHGVLNDASPMYSHILLAQEDGNPAEDGLLEAWELMDLSLNADLVVLSACETARGRVGAGEGVIGLSWALFVAGSSVSVVSQWKVESSSTTELMLEFHRSLRRLSGTPGRRMSTTNALQSSAKKLLANREYRHPFYWAGFVVVGDGR